MIEKIKLFERQRRKDLIHKCGVYAIFVDNHVYVGSSENLSRRLSEHRIDILKKDRGCRFLHYLYENSSKDDFYYAILEYCTPEKRLLLEKYYIELLGADCNTAKDPQNPVTRCTEIHQYSTTGKYLQSYPSLADAARAVDGSEGNISSAAIQRRYAYNSLWAYIKENHYPHIPTTKLKTKKVYMFDTSFQYLREFTSISDAARYIMSSYDEYQCFDSLCIAISKSCSEKKIKKFGDYCFSYNKVIYIPPEEK